VMPLEEPLHLPIDASFTRWVNRSQVPRSGSARDHGDREKYRGGVYEKSATQWRERFGRYQLR